MSEQIGIFIWGVFCGLMFVVVVQIVYIWHTEFRKKRKEDPRDEADRLYKKMERNRKRAPTMPVVESESDKPPREYKGAKYWGCDDYTEEEMARIHGLPQVPEEQQQAGSGGQLNRKPA